MHITKYLNVCSVLVHCERTECEPTNNAGRAGTEFGSALDRVKHINKCAFTPNIYSILLNIHFEFRPCVYGEEQAPRETNNNNI